MLPAPVPPCQPTSNPRRPGARRRAAWVVIVLSVIATIAMLTGGPSPDAGAQPRCTVTSTSQQRARLQAIARMIWDKAPERRVLAAWAAFVESQKRLRPDFGCGIRYIFQSLKTHAEAKAKNAKARVEQAKVVKDAIRRERALVRSARSQHARSGKFAPIPRKRFAFTKSDPPKAIIQTIGMVRTVSELSDYEGVLVGSGKEASLLGTGGVALLEYAKDAIQTAVSNISGVGTMAVKMRKTVERKMGEGSSGSGGDAG